MVLSLLIARGYSIESNVLGQWTSQFTIAYIISFRHPYNTRMAFVRYSINMNPAREQHVILQIT